MKWTKKGLLLTLTMGLAVMAAVACGSDEETTSTTDGAATQAAGTGGAGAAATTAAGAATQAAGAVRLAANQTMTYNGGGEPDFLDPQRASFATDINIVKQLFRPMLWYDKDLNVVPMVASQVPTTQNGGISADGKTYTFKMKPGQKWSDGKELTAKDFEFALKRLFDPSLAGDYSSFYFNIVGAQEYYTALGTKEAPKSPSATELTALRDKVGVKAVDATTLTVTLKEQEPTILTKFALWPTMPVREDVVAKGEKWTEAGALIGNGPFTLKEWAHDNQIVLARNENYTAGEKATLTQITVKQIKDAQQAYAGYLNNELDAVAVPPAQTKAVEADAKLSKENLRVPELTTFGVQMNVKKAPLDDKSVRQAIAYGIDREAYRNGIRQGIGTVAYSWVPPGMPGYLPEMGKEYKFDAAKAKQLIQQSGKGGQISQLKILTSDASVAQQTAQFIQAQFKQNLGLDIGIDVVDSKTYQSRVVNEQFDMVFGGWGADYPDPENWYPELFGTGAGNNHQGFSNAKFDDLMKQAARELDNTKRLAIYAESAKILNDEQPTAFVWYRQRNSLIKPKVKGLIVTGLDASGGDWFFEKIQIEQQ